MAGVGPLPKTHTGSNPPVNKKGRPREGRVQPERKSHSRGLVTGDMWREASKSEIRFMALRRAKPGLRGAAQEGTWGRKESSPWCGGGGQSGNGEMRTPYSPQASFLIGESLTRARRDTYENVRWSAICKFRKLRNNLSVFQQARG